MFEHLKVIIKNKFQFLVKTAKLKSFGLDIEIVQNTQWILLSKYNVGKAKIWFKVELGLRYLDIYGLAFIRNH